MKKLSVRRGRGKGRRVPVLLSMVLTVALLILMTVNTAQANPDIKTALLEMAKAGRQFKPDELHKGGRETLVALLDDLLPERKAVERPVLSEAQVQQLIKQLGHADYRTREDATKRLIRLGKPYTKLIEETLASDDLEIRARAQVILSTWKEAKQATKIRNIGIYSGAFGVYVDGLTDPECLRELARRVHSQLKSGLPPTKGELRILEHCLRVVARTGDDKTCNILTPLLEHKDPVVAVWVIKQVGAHSGNKHFPELLLVALQSDVEAVVSEAISKTPNCWDRARAPLVKRHLKRIFEGDSETLKFAACFPLMHDHHDKRAVAYLIEQAQSADPRRARRAISWLGDSCNHGRKVTPELLEALAPLLRSKDMNLRRAAADALGTYSGEEVVKQLIPLLADDEQIIVIETRQNLVEQTDEAMLRRLLARAKTNSRNPLVRKRTTALLEAYDSSE